MKEQDEILDKTESFVKSGGRLLYITCSLIREENEDRLVAFLSRHPDFSPISVPDLVEEAGLPHLAEFASPFGLGLRVSPLFGGTDGFFVAGLRRS